MENRCASQVCRQIGGEIVDLLLPASVAWCDKAYSLYVQYAPRFRLLVMPETAPLVHNLLRYVDKSAQPSVARVDTQGTQAKPL